MKSYNFILIACITVTCLDEALLAKSDSEPILGQLMHIWSLVNIARSIAEQDSFFLNHQMFDAYLTLYAFLYCALQHEYLSLPQIASIDTILRGLITSHNELCATQKQEDSFYLKRLMAAICNLWKQEILKMPGNEYITQSSSKLSGDAIVSCK